MASLTLFFLLTAISSLSHDSIKIASSTVYKIVPDASSSVSNAPPSMSASLSSPAIHWDPVPPLGFAPWTPATGRHRETWLGVSPSPDYMQNHQELLLAINANQLFISSIVLSGDLYASGVPVVFHQYEYSVHTTARVFPLVSATSDVQRTIDSFNHIEFNRKDVHSLERSDAPITPGIDKWKIMAMAAAWAFIILRRPPRPQTPVESQTTPTPHQESPVMSTPGEITDAERVPNQEIQGMLPPQTGRERPRRPLLPMLLPPLQATSPMRDLICWGPNKFGRTTVSIEGRRIVYPEVYKQGHIIVHGLDRCYSTLYHDIAQFEIQPIAATEELSKLMDYLVSHDYGLLASWILSHHDELMGRRLTIFATEDASLHAGGRSYIVLNSKWKYTQLAGLDVETLNLFEGGVLGMTYTRGMVCHIDYSPV